MVFHVSRAIFSTKKKRALVSFSVNTLRLPAHSSQRLPYCQCCIRRTRFQARRCFSRDRPRRSCPTTTCFETRVAEGYATQRLPARDSPGDSNEESRRQPLRTPRKYRSSDCGKSSGIEQFEFRRRAPAPRFFFHQRFIGNSDCGYCRASACSCGGS